MSSANIMQSLRGTRARGKMAQWRCLVALAAGLSGILFSWSAQAAAFVDTIGGGPLQGHPNPAGYLDGNTFFESQFNGPYSTALDSQNNLYVADKNNNVIRRVTLAGNTNNSLTETYLTGLSAPVGVAVDAADNLYVITQGANEFKLRKFDALGNVLFTVPSSSNFSDKPTALTIAQDSTTNIYITLLDGNVVEVKQDQSYTTNINGLNQPKGIAFMPNGLLAVSDTGNNVIKVFNRVTHSLTLLAGKGLAGFADSAVATNAQFNQPHGLAASADGRLVVADKANNRVRLIAANGATTTIYGVDANKWNSSYYPGWQDGFGGANTITNAAAREPVSVTVSPAGLVFVTELYYHLLRDVTGSGLSSYSTNVPSPTFSPQCGYFPDCVTVYVTNDLGTVYYTMDGSEPTTNSANISTSYTGFNYTGSVKICDGLHDLSFLRLKAISGTNASATVSGLTCPTNEIGFTHDYTNGPGSTAIIPIVINLRSNDVVRTLQYRVEVTPTGGNPNLVSDQFRTLPITANDFVRVIGPGEPDQDALISVISYFRNDTGGRGLLITTTGTNSHFLAVRAAAAAMLAVPIPATATEGQTYRLDILFVSASSDGGQTPVAITNMTSRTIHVGFKEYLVGDSSFGGWYNAGDFGNADLNNNDVNNAIYASVGLGTPYSFSDVFDAMDVYPPDHSSIVGGDGAIRFLDWETILERSERFDPNNWMRSWSVGGVRTNRPVGTLPVAASSLKARTPTKSAPPGAVWQRQGSIGATTLTNVSPGNYYMIPVYAKVLPDYSLAGLQFRATLSPQGNAPSVSSIQFLANNGMPNPSYVLSGGSANDLVCAWQIGSFVFPLQGSNLLGHIRFQVPFSAQPGQSYVLHISKPDGAADFQTQYDLESIPGTAWVQSSAQQPAEIISDEWKLNFFGSLSNPLAENNADPDGDGFSNWQEYLAGTNPTNSSSCLKFNNPGLTEAHAVALRWMTAPGKNYILERSPSVHGAGWTTLSNVVGDGYLKEVIDSNPASQNQFYRIRILSP